MIDLPTQKEMESPHHRRALWALIAAGVIFAGLIAAYVVNPQPQEEQGGAIREDFAAQKMAELAKPNPTVTLTVDEVILKKAVLAEKNPKVNLTPEQIKAKRLVLENI